MQEQLDRIAAFFGLGEIRGFERAGGYTNANYFTSTARGEYLVKVATGPCDAEDRRLVQAYLERLADSGFRVVPCLKAGDGNLLYVEGNVVATVQERLDAEAPQSLTEDMAAQIGVELARLHFVPYRHLPERKNWLHAGHLDQMATAVKKSCLEAEGAKELVAAHEALETTWDRLPQAILHSDLYADNTLFREGRLACFIDWDEVCIGAAVLDFGTAVIGCCFRGDRFDQGLYAALRKSYEQTRRFSDEERKAVTASVRYAAVTCAIWRLLNRDRLGDRYKLYWAQGLDRWAAP